MVKVVIGIVFNAKYTLEQALQKSDCNVPHEFLFCAYGFLAVFRLHQQCPVPSAFVVQPLCNCVVVSSLVNYLRVLSCILVCA